ncbi:MAG: hypothetical protein HRT88_12995, partial [Lentisphaeraceae bacterium]|nr:hypothetical protein [Lentisphaeraceae bacterium]
MTHDSSETTGIKRLLFIVFAWALISSWISSSAENDSILADVERKLLHYAVTMDVDGAENEHNKLIGVTLINARGEVIKSPYGEVKRGQSFDSQEYKNALQG